MLQYWSRRFVALALQVSRIEPYVPGRAKLLYQLTCNTELAFKSFQDPGQVHRLLCTTYVSLEFAETSFDCTNCMLETRISKRNMQPGKEDVSLETVLVI